MMNPVMSLHEMTGFWEGEEGNVVTSLFVNPAHVIAIWPYGDAHYYVKLHGMVHGFIVKADTINIANPSDVMEEMMQEAAMVAIPDDGEGN